MSYVTPYELRTVASALAARAFALAEDCRDVAQKSCLELQKWSTYFHLQQDGGSLRLPRDLSWRTEAALDTIRDALVVECEQHRSAGRDDDADVIHGAIDALLESNSVPVTREHRRPRNATVAHH